MHLISWNVNGLRAVLNKGFGDWLAQCGADVVCLQETKARPDQVDPALFDGWFAHWNSAEKPGYSGVLTLTRRAPQSVHHGIKMADHDREGRVLTVEFADWFVVNCYTPNSQDGLRRLPYRQQWDQDFRAFLQALDAEKPVLLGGDLNVAHAEIDLARPAANRNSAGFSDPERAGLNAHLAAGWLDSFRHLYPDQKDAYSWWSFRGGARTRNVGWRIDYWLTSARLAPRIQAAAIHPETLGSDHCPVSIILSDD